MILPFAHLACEQNKEVLLQEKEMDHPIVHEILLLTHTANQYVMNQDKFFLVTLLILINAFQLIGIYS